MLKQQSSIFENESNLFIDSFFNDDSSIKQQSSIFENESNLFIDSSFNDDSSIKPNTKSISEDTINFEKLCNKSDTNDKSDRNMDSIVKNNIDSQNINTKFNPSKPVIATMTLISEINANIDLLNFSKYLTLDKNSIISVKFNKDSELIERSLEPSQPIKKKKKPKKYFYNQCTIIIKCENNKKVNLKLFLNGKIQMTGCKSTVDANNALDILRLELLSEKYILTNNKIIKKEIIDNTNFIINDPSIALINCVFHSGLNINRDILHQLLINTYHIPATYQPIIYVGINSKYIPTSGNKVSILIFQTGKIILTAGKTMKDIEESFDYICNILRTHQSEIEN
jgi:TATA-box binding protein (TBP) (component of TFIID and TFIIIB)